MRMLVLALTVTILAGGGQSALACRGGGRALPAPPPISSETKALFEKARALHERRQFKEAIPIYKQAVKGGHGGAAKALGEIYWETSKELDNYGESLKWYGEAERLGVKIEKAC